MIKLIFDIYALREACSSLRVNVLLLKEYSSEQTYDYEQENCIHRPICCSVDNPPSFFMKSMRIENCPEIDIENYLPIERVSNECILPLP